MDREPDQNKEPTEREVRQNPGRRPANPMRQPEETFQQHQIAGDQDAELVSPEREGGHHDRDNHEGPPPALPGEQVEIAGGQDEERDQGMENRAGDRHHLVAEGERKEEDRR